MLLKIDSGEKRTGAGLNNEPKNLAYQPPLKTLFSCPMIAAMPGRTPNLQPAFQPASLMGTPRLPMLQPFDVMLLKTKSIF
jgi:hypothetical protein